MVQWYVSSSRMKNVPTTTTKVKILLNTVLKLCKQCIIHHFASALCMLEIVDFFFVDTTPFVDHYWTNPEGHHYDWREVTPPQTYISTLLKVLLLFFFSFVFNPI
ncbi:hypothetical protein BHE74_00011286 [Ensete ventricosum]|nr:hypothetical protein BHE74_00011286 [Ensete ventricosum]